MKRPELRRLAAERDEDRQRLFFTLTLGFWLLIFAFLVLRDPVWRVLHREGLLPTAAAASGWVQLDRRLVVGLSGASGEAPPGREDLEREIVAALAARRAQLAPNGLAPTDLLRNLARARAAARLALPAGREVEAPELRYPEVALGLKHPDRLVRSVVVFQSFPEARPATGFGRELVSGWMNRGPFADLVRQGGDLEVGVGAVAAPEGGGMVEVLLVETVIRLDQPLPAVGAVASPLALSGAGSPDEEIRLFVKGPADPGFAPVDLGWSDRGFAWTLTWEQGPGGYLLRAGRGQRISDPRPVFVE